MMVSLLVPEVLLMLTLVDKISPIVTKDLQNMQSEEQSPAILSVTDSGPSCFDAFITFTASLSFQNGATANAKTYKYKWVNNVDTLRVFLYQNITYGAEYSLLTTSFARGLIPLFSDLLNFTMRVSVYRQNASSTDYEKNPFVTKDHNFYLTSGLNGVLMMAQDTGLKRRGKCFETHKKISLRLDLTDEFRQKKFTYTWTYAVGKTIKTSIPELEVMYDDTGNQEIHVSVKGDVFNSEGKRQSKSGDFSSKFTLLDPVQNISLSNTATSNIYPHNTYRTNITCSGSEPFSFCVNVTKPKATTSEVIECTSVSLKNCFWDFSYQANVTGIYKVTVHVENNVSAIAKDIELRVFQDPGPVSAYLPVLCVFIWCFVVFIVFYTYRKDHARSNVESADFDFYSIQSNSLSLWHSFRDFFYELFHRDRHQQEGLDSRFSYKEFTDYGSLESSVNSGQSLKVFDHGLLFTKG